MPGYRVTWAHPIYITGMFWWNFISPDPSSVLDYIQNCLPGTETEGLERGHLSPAPKTQIRPYQLYHGIVWGGGRCRWKKSPLCTENLEQGVPALCIPKSCLASLESTQGQRHPSNLRPEGATPGSTSPLGRGLEQPGSQVKGFQRAFPGHGPSPCADGGFG